MTQIEQIRAEIRRLDEKYRRVRVSGMSQQAKEADLVVHVLQGLSNFLDALEEPSLPSDVDEAAKEEYPDTGEASVDFKLIQRREDFKAGAEWQKSQMISALKNDGELPIEFIDKFHEIDRNAFQNGQKNVKEQMLKKSMPTWKMSRNNYEDPCIGSAFEKTGRRYTALYMGGYFIDLDDLFNKLPKEQDI